MNDNSAAAATAASVIGGMIIGYGIVLVAILAFTVWIYWRIFVKAGYNGALALLNLVPGVGPLVVMVILAFGRWPIEDELAALRASAHRCQARCRRAPCRRARRSCRRLSTQSRESQSFSNQPSTSPGFEGNAAERFSAPPLVTAMSSSMRTPMPRKRSRNGCVVGLKVESRLDGEHHALAQPPVAVLFFACVRAVVNVEAQHVADAVKRVAPVRAAGPDRALRRAKP